MVRGFLVRSASPVMWCPVTNATPPRAKTQPNNSRLQAHLLEDLPGLQQSVLLSFCRFGGSRQHERGIEWQALIQQAMRGEMYVTHIFAQGLGMLFGRFFSQILQLVSG